MPKVLNKYKDVISDNDIYIGRPSAFGNPYVIDEYNSREDVIRDFEDYVNKKPELIALIKKELKGKNLVCFCSPKACHGDVLLKIANEE